MAAAHKPTEKTRIEVAALAGFGARAEDIAAYLGISDKTLAKHYKEELKTGSIKANAAIAKTLFNAAKEGNVSACIFWLKTRAGWRETQSVELSGPDKGPVAVKNAPDLSRLSEEELRQLDGILEKAESGPQP